MIMAGLEFTKCPPFRDIYIHGLLRDKSGRKMSKSLGNGIDPLETVTEYGADALKFTLAFLCAQGQDILIEKESFKLGSKFANKLWNASRYILQNLDGRNYITNPALITVDNWIYARLQRAAKTIANAFVSYRYNEAAAAAYEFFWNDFCDWYVEATKISTKCDDDTEKDRSVSLLLNVLCECLKLLHPLLPFVTEEIYGKLPDCAKQNDAMLIVQRYPSPDNLPKLSADIQSIENNFSVVQNIISAIRTLRSECTITPEKKINVTLKVESASFTFVKENAALISLLASLGDLQIEGESESDRPCGTPQGAVGLAGSGFEAFVFIAGIVDIAALKAKWTSSIEKDKKYIKQIEAKISNENFIKNAQPQLVQAEKDKLKEVNDRISKIEVYLKEVD
ncbi:MAG: hypothetical protein Ta2B_20940 [Termitinemataceae bacterium]|nr:MAG: hypothetical protein Ta2B_20940 [Termitinemataceae bacterium]